MKNLLLFDVDNTLSISRGKVTEEIKELLAKLSTRYDLATVSGSDLPKMLEQLGSSAMYFRWLFTENGLVAYLDHYSTISENNNGPSMMGHYQLAAPYHKTDIIKELGEDYYQRFVNRALELISQTKLEKKRGTFVELRNGLVNVCPIGRNCSQEERDAFEAYDKTASLKFIILYKYY
jgi:phosphomannomutase